MKSEEHAVKTGKSKRLQKQDHVGRGRVMKDIDLISKQSRSRSGVFLRRFCLKRRISASDKNSNHAMRMMHAFCEFDSN